MTDEQSSTSKPWYRKWWAITLGVLIVIGFLGNLGSSEEPAVDAMRTTTTVADVVTTPTTVADVATTPTTVADVATTPTTVADVVTTTTAPSATTVPASQFTRAEENAIRSADNYLDYTAFSRSGLIEQLEFEGFSTADATLAVDYHDVDWNEQAWLSAEAYLDYTTFSRSGLIEQLEFEGFTTAQATYGVNKTGL